MGAASEFRVETPRLALGPLKAEDGPALGRIATDPRVAPMMGTIPVPWPDAARALWIARSRFRGDVGFRLGIAGRHDGRVIGVCGLGGAPAALAYFLDPDEWGKGYATEAMHAFVSACFARFRWLDVIAADHFADNPGSARVLAKLGFEPTGRGMGRSLARLEPAPNIHYRLFRVAFEASHEIP
ncbi:GNAT family N-acetyltransferase [Rhodovulum marinum]|uniref:RimJ/RimL family protein N-acetyltransferase n=1 Tax=Rhodovulum marinum TaxID=320662 RepID=A0A4R2Q048_9RHOB|nr:GNAT family N-acetyltransferase [Rhodovulum marinum]TCP40898.1 RimJ/RimL family protein N-acetyltransferase [Rhodovulum marinum]